MPKYYCDYCDSHLTHDSMSVRKTHNKGKKHRDNVIQYYQSYYDADTQRHIDYVLSMAASGVPLPQIQGMFQHVPGVQPTMPPMFPTVGMPNMTGAPPANGQMPFHGYGMPGVPMLPPPHMMHPNMMPPPMNGPPPGFQPQFYGPPPQYPPQFHGPPPSQ